MLVYVLIFKQSYDNSHRTLRDSVRRIFVHGFFRHQLLVPTDTLRSNFEFNTMIEELFDLKGDSPVYSLLGSLDFPVYLPPESSDSPVYLPLGSLDSPTYSSSGSQKFDGVFTAGE